MTMVNVVAGLGVEVVSDAGTAMVVVLPEQKTIMLLALHIEDWGDDDKIAAGFVHQVLYEVFEVLEETFGEGYLPGSDNPYEISWYRPSKHSGLKRLAQEGLGFQPSGTTYALSTTKFIGKEEAGVAKED